MKCIPGSFVQLKEADWDKLLPKGLYGVIDYQDESGKLHVVWEDGKKTVMDPSEDTIICCGPPDTGTKRITVLVVEPGKEPYDCRIYADFRDYQKIVGGYCQELTLADGCLLFCNEEGRLDGLPGNRTLDNGEIICGTFFITANGESLSPEQKEEYYYRFRDIEDFSNVQIPEQKITIESFDDDFSFFMALLGLNEGMER